MPLAPQGVTIVLPSCQKYGPLEHLVERHFVDPSMAHPSLFVMKASWSVNRSGVLMLPLCPQSEVIWPVCVFTMEQPLPTLYTTTYTPVP